MGRDVAADPAGDSVAVHRLVHDRAGAVRRLFRRRDLRAASSTTCSATSARSSTARRSSSLHGAAGSRRCISRSPALALAWFLYIKRPDLPAVIAATLSAALQAARQQVLLRRDLPGGVRGRQSSRLGTALWRVGDVALIDGRWSMARRAWSAGCRASCASMQSGYLYHYAFAMIIGLSVLLAWYVLRLDSTVRSTMHVDDYLAHSECPDLAADRRRRGHARCSATRASRSAAGSR